MSFLTIRVNRHIDSDDFGQEIDFVFTWEPNKSLFVSPAIGIFRPGDGGKATLPGDDDTNIYFQLFFILFY